MAQTEEYRRSDGRGATTMRKLGIEIGGLSKSDGSARFGFGESIKHHIRCDKSMQSDILYMSCFCELQAPSK